MKVTLFTGFLTVVFGLASASFGQGTIVLYDPQSKLPDTAQSADDERFVKEQLVPKVRAKWSEDDCPVGNLNIVGVADGSFTRSGAKQRAFVYELCQTGNGFANNGVAVVDNGEAVAHFTVEGGWNLEVSRVADLNGDGRDEIAIETSGGMHQGYTGTSLTILEVSAAQAKDLGVFVVYTNECETLSAGKYCDRSYKLTAKSGASPAFFTQKYVNRGTDEKPRWIVSGKPAPAKPIAGINTKYELVK